jgi:hypothetical protein
MRASNSPPGSMLLVWTAPKCRVHHGRQRTVAQLHRRYIHRQDQVVGPSRCGAAGTAEQLFVHAHDQAGFLGQRDELGGGNKAAFWMRSARQHLEADQSVVGAERDERLEAGQQLVGHDGSA